MDMERIEKDKRWMNEERRTRLMQAHELPDWALKDDDDIVQQVQEATQEVKDDEILGRGSRARKTVTYADTLSENDWLRAVESGTLEERETRENARLKVCTHFEFLEPNVFKEYTL